MEEFIKAVENFITRDLMYILGGSILLSSLLVTFGHEESLLTFISTGSILQTILAFGFSYVVGYVTLEISRLIWIIPPIYKYRPSQIIQRSYSKFAGVNWINPPDDNPYDSVYELYSDAHDRVFIELQRLITLKHIGSTIGACSLIGSIFLAVYALRVDIDYIIIVIFLFVFSLLLLLAGRLKAAQQAQFMSRFIQNANSDNSTDEVVEVESSN